MFHIDRMSTRLRIGTPLLRRQATLCKDRTKRIAAPGTKDERSVYREAAALVVSC